MSSELENLSDLDALFLAAETPSQHLHVVATLVLDRSTTSGENVFEVFQSRIKERYQLIEPLRRSPMRSFLGRPLWVDDPNDHLQRHLHHVLIEHGGSIDALAEVAGEVASHPLPRDRPLWEAWLVEGFDEDHWAVIAKIHHSAVDGVSGIFALAGFFDLEPSPMPSALPPNRVPERPSTAAVLSTTIGALLKRPAAVAGGMRLLTASVVQLVSSRSDTAPLPATGPRMPYNRALTPRRSVAFATLPLEGVKRVAKGFGVSINDLVVGLCAGVLRRQALQSKEEPPARPVVAAVPVSERKPEDGPSGNRLSFMFYALPVHLPTARERVAFVKRSADDAKEVYARAGKGLFAAFAAVVPQFAVGPAMRAMCSVRAANMLPPLVNVLISSIKGPELPLYVAGSKLSSMFPMGPVIEGVGLGITAVSFSDGLAFGFIGCPDLIDDIREFALGLHLEIAEMEDCLG